MQPLNQKERNNLFFQFLLFYVVSILVVLFAAFGNILMSKKQNIHSQEDFVRLENHIKSSDDFFMQMGKVERILTKATNSEQAFHSDEEFQKEKRTLSALADKQDSTRMKQLGWYKIIDGYNSRWDDLKNMTDQDKLVQAIKEKDASIDKLEKEYAKLDREYTTYVKTHN